jgi:hypothetical protein
MPVPHVHQDFMRYNWIYLFFMSLGLKPNSADRLTFWAMVLQNSWRLQCGAQASTEGMSLSCVPGDGRPAAIMICSTYKFLTIPITTAGC